MHERAPAERGLVADDAGEDLGHDAAGPMAFTRMPYGASARAMHLHNLNIYMLEKHPP